MAVVAAAAIPLAASASATGSGANSILIGSIAGTTGVSGSAGVAMVDGARMAVADLNARGGVLGKQLVLESADDQGSATVAAQLYVKLVADGAVAVVGSDDTGPATAAMAQRLHVPDIGAVDHAGIAIYPDGPGTPPLEWVWSWGMNTFAWGAIDAHYAQRHCSRLAVLHDPSAYGDGGDAAIKLAYSGSSRKIVLDDAVGEDWSKGATAGLTSEIDRIKTAGADCAVAWLTPQDVARFVQALESRGVKLTVLGNDEINADAAFSSLAKSAGDGVIGATITASVKPDAALASFRTRYKARFHRDATPLAAADYDAVRMLAQVITKAVSTNPGKLQDGLNAVRNFHGLQGTVSFSKQRHASVTEQQLTLVRYDAVANAWLPLG
jgi:branched-chain amino acid transport system substrate-binding protein